MAQLRAGVVPGGPGPARAEPAAVGYLLALPVTGAVAVAPPVAVGVADGPYALAVADLDANGLLDLVTSNDLGRSLSVALQGPARAFTAASAIPVQVGAPRGVAAGHLDGDEFLDLAVGGELGLEIFTGDGAGGFAPARFIATAAEFEAVKIVDLDGDGRDDLVAADRIGNAIAVYPGVSPRGNAAGGNATRAGREVDYPPLAFGVDRGPADFDPVDLDGDGGLDLAVVARQGDRLTMLLTGQTGSGSAGPSRATAPAGPSRALAVEWTANPFTEGTAVRVTLAEAVPLTLEVFDVAGRRVATVAGGPPAPGRRILAFTGRDHRGRPLARGVYFYRLAAGDRAARGKLVKR